MLATAVFVTTSCSIIKHHCTKCAYNNLHTLHLKKSTFVELKHVDCCLKFDKYIYKQDRIIEAQI